MYNIYILYNILSVSNLHISQFFIGRYESDFDVSHVLKTEWRSWKARKNSFVVDSEESIVRREWTY